MSSEKNGDKISIFARIIDFIFGRNGDSERSKLRNVCRQLNKSGYKYYQFGQDLVKPAFASYVFSVYRIVAPLREFFISHNNSEDYKERIISHNFTEKQFSLLSAVLPQNIQEQSKKIRVKELASQARHAFSDFENGLTDDIVNNINNTYCNISILCQFCLFDFYMLLKKFDSTLAENSFTDVPKFTPAPRDFVGTEIEDFLNNAYFLIAVTDWDETFNFLNSMEGFPGIDVQDFNRLLNSLTVLEKKRVIVRMAKLIKKDSSFEYFVQLQQQDVINPFIQNAHSSMESTLQDIETEDKVARVLEFQHVLFGETNLSVPKNYNDEQGNIYYNKGLPQFNHVESATYMNSFFDFYMKKEILDFSEIFTIRGKSKIAGYIQQIATTYHNLVECSTNFTRFDKMLNEKFNTGYKLHSLLERMKTDSDAAIELTDELNKVNSECETLITSTVACVEDLYIKFQELLNERKENKKDKVSNWDEVDRFLKVKSLDALSSICAHMDIFVRLMKVEMEGSVLTG